MTRVNLSYLEQVDPRFFKFIIWREAYNLWHARQIARRVAAWMVMREEEGNDASHLWHRIPVYRQSAQAYATELDRLGWLVPIERIMKSERFRRQYAHQD